MLDINTPNFAIMKVMIIARTICIITGMLGLEWKNLLLDLIDKRSASMENINATNMNVSNEV